MTAADEQPLLMVAALFGCACLQVVTGRDHKERLSGSNCHLKAVSVPYDPNISQFAICGTFLKMNGSRLEPTPGRAMLCLIMLRQPATFSGGNRPGIADIDTLHGWSRAERSLSRSD